MPPPGCGPRWRRWLMITRRGSASSWPSRWARAPRPRRWLRWRGWPGGMRATRGSRRRCSAPPARRRRTCWPPWPEAAALRDLLGPSHPPELQSAAVRALSVHPAPQVAGLLLGSWNNYSPVLRREVLEGIFARPDRLAVLLDAVEKKKVLVGQLEP